MLNNSIYDYEVEGFESKIRDSIYLSSHAYDKKHTNLKPKKRKRTNRKHRRK